MKFYIFITGLTVFSYFSFYLNCGKIKNIFAKPEENANWFNSGETWTEVAKKLPALGFLSIMLTAKLWQLLYYLTLDPETSTLGRAMIQCFKKIITRAPIGES